MTTDQKVFSADAHVTVTNERLLRHVPGGLKERARAYLESLPVDRSPAVPRTEEAPSHPASPLSAPVLSLSKEETGERSSQRKAFPALGRPGQWDPLERAKDMDLDGIHAEVLYSQTAAYHIPPGNPPAIDGMSLYPMKDRELRLALMRAYNDGLAEYAAAVPGRLFPIGLIPIDDIDDGVAELKRLQGMGFRGIRLPTYPDTLGLESYWDRRYDPLFSAAQDLETPISLHAAASRGLKLILDPTPAQAIVTSVPPMYMAELVSGWIVSGLLPRFPTLKVVLVESGIGWIAYYLERLDTMFRRRSWLGRVSVSQNPSIYWHKHFAATFEDDFAGVRTRDLIGVDTIMWGSDYPHPDCTWPESRKVLAEHFHGVPEEETRKMVYGNAARLYHLK